MANAQFVLLLNFAEREPYNIDNWEEELRQWKEWYEDGDNNIYDFCIKESKLYYEFNRRIKGMVYPIDDDKDILKIALLIEKQETEKIISVDLYRTRRDTRILDGWVCGFKINERFNLRSCIELCISILKKIQVED